MGSPIHHSPPPLPAKNLGEIYAREIRGELSFNIISKGGKKKRIELTDKKGRTCQVAIKRFQPSNKDGSAPKLSGLDRGYVQIKVQIDGQLKYAVVNKNSLEKRTGYHVPSKVKDVTHFVNKALNWGLQKLASYSNSTFARADLDSVLKGAFKHISKKELDAYFKENPEEHSKLVSITLRKHTTPDLKRDQEQIHQVIDDITSTKELLNKVYQSKGKFIPESIELRLNNILQATIELAARKQKKHPSY